ncbi:Mannan endo-1,6-alpha-mannosidase [Cordyceps fumosorosea ARSEF 2679]|uniref:Mannan endo-1,6-alpha-mannosidase n=1 Tax=Cordyceps fumosorosea (strain ARSEF 2679) TaxID=1081104 RepID=A0A167NBT1_CORFA|nr:Mannan endo-1,6-alpha-mannosidase [Cordyceps fumosorosea ARSEF 2679]OAA55369.1 Mannan endo-1,6-alpha-mannosidase [Cordyceps fumosorosea ARSEF 2679]
MKALAVGLASLLLAVPTKAALELDLSSTSSIKSVASSLAYGLVKFYNGNTTAGIPGLLGGKYYWWEAGGMFGHLIDYWYYTGDSTYNDIVMQAMMHQINAPAGDFLPRNQTNAMGNDDQGFWALTTMMAAEAAFPNPPSDTPQWLAGGQAVFNEYVARWREEDGLCGGGLRWQVYSFLSGYDYKNSIANGCFFNVAARLARFTGNDTYAEWAAKIYEWEVGIGLITADYEVYDGIEVKDAERACRNIHAAQFSYNAGVWLAGSAAMYDYTKNDTWKTRIDGLLNFTTNMFVSTEGGHLWEPPCEQQPTGCDQNQVSFKGYLIRFLSFTAKLAPWTADGIAKIVRQAATDAVAVCTGPQNEGYPGPDGTGCGFSYLSPTKYDGKTGVGQQMNAMAAVYYNLLADAKPPATGEDRGTSKGNPNAGSNQAQPLPEPRAIVASDRAGAAILTILFTSGIVAGSFFLMSNVFD